MITVNVVHRIADSDKILELGRTIQLAGGVLDMEVSEGNYSNLFQIRAKVRGSNRSDLDIEMYVDEEEDKIYGAFCHCRDFDSGIGLCKHCVAVLLEYLFRRDNGKLYEEGKGPTRCTDIKLLEIMDMVARRDKVKYFIGEYNRKVSIEPYIKSDWEGIRVSFRIGVNQMYVMKSLADFASAMYEREQLCYGKKLDFIHAPEAFTEESEPLALLIMQWGLGNIFPYYSRIKEILLRGETLDDFMQAMIGRTIHGEIYPMKSKEWTMTEENYSLKMSLKREESGYLLTLGKVHYWEGRSYYYFIQQGKIIRVPRSDFDSISEVIEEIEGMDQEYYISQADMPLFVRDMLPELKKHGKIKSSGLELDQYLPEAVKYEFYLDAPQRDMVMLKGFSIYGETKYNLYEAISIRQPRDMGEIEIQKKVGAYFTAYSEEEYSLALYQDEEALYRLLREGIPLMQSIGTVFLSDKMKGMQVRSTPKVAMGISVGEGLLTMNLDVSEMSLEELSQILSRYDRKKKYYRLRDGSFVDMNSDLKLLAEIKSDLNVGDKDWEKGRVTVPQYRAFYLDAVLRDENGLIAEQSQDFKALIQNMKTFEESCYKVPESLKDTLREYQKTGFQWLRILKCNGFGGILADDMGLGKTVQVIAMLLSLKEEGTLGRVLIVTPASLVFNWLNEIARFAPTLKAETVTGSQAGRQRILQGGGEQDILITSYDLLKRDCEWYQDIHFDIEILDEAQFIKNANTQSAESVKRIASSFRLALTGTPVENRLSELWSIFDYLMPGFLYTYTRFRKEFEVPVVNEGEKEVLYRLQRMIRPFVLRRMKKDVLKDLPDKLEEVVYTRLEGEQRQLYDAHVQRMKLFLEEKSEQEINTSKIYILSELTRLRQLCCSPDLLYEAYKGPSAKPQLCMQYLEEAVAGGHKVLVFSQFTSVLSILCDLLTKSGIHYYLLTGKTAKGKRMEMVNSFQEDDVPVFLISLKAGGTGLNLTAADIVIHFDPWWNIAAQNQATDRVHRIGQKNKVNVYKLIARDTIEDRIVEMQERKQELASQLLNGDSAETLRFSREELLQLLS